jgi:hypothetical protein
MGRRLLGLAGTVVRMLRPFNQSAWYWTGDTGVNCINGTVAEPHQTYMSDLSNDGLVIGGSVRPEFGPSTEAVRWLNLEPVNWRQYLLDRGVSDLQSWSLRNSRATDHMVGCRSRTRLPIAMPCPVVLCDHA